MRRVSFTPRIGSRLFRRPLRADASPVGGDSLHDTFGSCTPGHGITARSIMQSASITARSRCVLNQAVLGKRSSFFSRTRRSQSETHRKRMGSQSFPRDSNRSWISRQSGFPSLNRLESMGASVSPRLRVKIRQERQPNPAKPKPKNRIRPNHEDTKTQRGMSSGLWRLKIEHGTSEIEKRPRRSTSPPGAF